MNTSTIKISSEDDVSLSVVFDPTGGQHSIPPGDHIRLVVDGPGEETLEITHGAEHISIWPSPNLRVSVFDSQGGKLQVLGY